MVLVQEGLVTKDEALERVAAIDLAALTDTALLAPGEPAASGIGASASVAPPSIRRAPGG